VILIKATGGIIDKFPYSMTELRAEYPNMSFPIEPSTDILSRFSVFIVFYQPFPVFDQRTQYVVAAQEPVLIDEVWTMTRSAVDKTPEEIAAYDLAELHDLKFKLFDDIDNKTGELIVYRWVYNDNPVRLTQEDQHNYEGEYNLIKDYLADGTPELAIFPTVFKVWTNEDGSPVFLPFTTFAEMRSFICAGKMYIKSCLTVGWTLKNTLNSMTIDELRAWVDPR
jgi:hypothetical protein